MVDNGALKTTLGISMAVISSEHFMSAGLSSPWSVKKFAVTQKDRDEVWYYWKEAAIASMLFGIFVGWMLKDWWVIIASILTIVYYYWLYRDALGQDIKF